MYCCQDTGEKVYLCFKIGFTAFRHSIFRTLKVILRQLEVCLPRDGQKCLVAGLKIGFTAFNVQFLEHMMFFLSSLKLHLPK